jgi:hypothetical protein
MRRVVMLSSSSGLSSQSPGLLDTEDEDNIIYQPIKHNLPLESSELNKYFSDTVKFKSFETPIINLNHVHEIFKFAAMLLPFIPKDFVFSSLIQYSKDHNIRVWLMASNECETGLSPDGKSKG